MRPITPASLVALALWLMLSLAADHGVAVDRISVDTGTGDRFDIVGISVGSADWKRWSFNNDWSFSFGGKRLAEDVVVWHICIAVHGECAHHGVKYIPLAVNAL